MYSLKHAAINARYLLRSLGRKPLLTARLALNYARALARPDRPPLRFADIAVTYACNMRCQHCSSTVLKRDEPTMTVEQYRVAARKLRRAGLLVANFTGGEPFVRADLCEIIAAFEPRSLLVAVQTNGMAVTREKLAELRALGVDALGVSIDGPRPDTHDPFRNSPGAFDKALSAIELGGSMGFNMGISYCLTSEGLRSPEHQEMIRLSKRFNALLNYNLAVPIGFWRGRTEGLFTDEDRTELTRMMEFYPRSKTDFETNYFRRGCGAIKEKLYLTAYGEVMPCPFIQVHFGNVLTDEVETIRNRALRYPYFNVYHPRCIAAQDRDFIDNTLCYSPLSQDMRLPLHHEQAFLDRERALGALPVESPHDDGPNKPHIG